MADVKICDRCKHIFENRNRWIYAHPERFTLKFIRLAWSPEAYEDYEHIDQRFDLCPKCMGDLDLFLKGKPITGLSFKEILI